MSWRRSEEASELRPGATVAARRVLAGGAVLLALACGGPGGPEAVPAPAPGEDTLAAVPARPVAEARGDTVPPDATLGSGGSPLFRRALRLLDEERFAAADSALRAVVDRCARTEEVGRAYLLLSSLHLDARNLRAHADSAALMAARYLYLPEMPPLGRRLAEGLYVQALDRGADPGLRPAPALAAAGSPAPGCGEARRSGEPVALPILESRVYSERLQDTANRLDSLAAAHERALGRVQELEAELERIRRLLQDPDTAGGRPGPGT